MKTLIVVFIIIQLAFALTLVNAVLQEDCIRIHIFDNDDDPVCDIGQPQNRTLRHISNVSVYYSGPHTDSAEIQMGSWYPHVGLVVISRWVGNYNHAPLYNGVYTFSDNSKQTIQDVACKLTENDTLPFGPHNSYKPSGDPTDGNLIQYCKNTTSVIENTFDIYNDIYVTMYTDSTGELCDYNFVLILDCGYIDCVESYRDAKLCGIFEFEQPTTTVTTVTTIPVTTTSTGSNHNITGYVMLISVISIIGTALLCLCIYGIYKHYKRATEQQDF